MKQTKSARAKSLLKSIGWISLYVALQLAATVYGKNDIRFTFKNEMEIKA